MAPPTLSTEIGDWASDKEVDSDDMRGLTNDKTNESDEATVPLTSNVAGHPPNPRGEGHVTVEKETKVQEDLEVCIISEIFRKLLRAEKLPDTVSDVPPDKDSPVLGEMLVIVKTRGGVGSGTKVIPRYSEYPEEAPIAVHVTPPPPVITLSVLPSIAGTPVSTPSVSPTIT